MTSRLEHDLQDVSQQIYEKMDTLLPSSDESEDNRLFNAMRYSALAQGKRLRPFLTVTAASLFGVSQASALQTAAAIEFVHTYSLIHDDLPAMDDDDMRRGQPSCHIEFDEATAILAGDGLLTLAFEVLADESTHSNATVRCQLIKNISKAVGCRGMVGGQVMDLLSGDKELSINEIVHLQRLKTGELFAISSEVGAILGSAPRNLRNFLRGYAHDIGLVFQITDDLLDSEMGDNDNHRQNRSDLKPTFVSAMGRDKAMEQAQILTKQAKQHLQPFGRKAALLAELADYILERSV